MTNNLLVLFLWKAACLFVLRASECSNSNFVRTGDSHVASVRHHVSSGLHLFLHCHGQFALITPQKHICNQGPQRTLIHVFHSTMSTRTHWYRTLFHPCRVFPLQTRNTVNSHALVQLCRWQLRPEPCYGGYRPHMCTWTHPGSLHLSGVPFLHSIKLAQQ